MPTIKLKNFKYGLDARKSNVESVAGTLTELENAHINQGGEIEKRKAFVYTAFPAGTFGAQATAAGIVTFGSAADPGGWAAISTAVGETVYYQRLVHPADTFEGTSTRVMDAILFSETFGLYAFAVATFADGQSFAYYNGTPVYDFTNGLILAHLSSDVKRALELTNIINRSEDFIAVQLANPNDHKVNMTGPLGTSYAVSVTDESLGLLEVTKTSEPTSGTEAREAVGSFRIIAGSYSANVNKITKVEVGPAAGPLVTITPTSGTTYVDWTNSNEFTAALLAAIINTHSSTPEYTAEANGDTVTIKALQADGDASNDYVVVVTAAGNVCIGKVQFQIQSVAGFNITALMINGASVLTGGTIAVTSASGAATAVVADINASTGTHGYIANATGAVISISKAVTRSDDANLPIYFVNDAPTGSGDGIFEIGGTGGSVSTMRAVLVYTGFTATDAMSSGWTRGYFNFSLAISGGVPPYVSVVWFGNGATPVNKISNSQYRMMGYTNRNTIVIPPSVYCRVTDSAGMTVDSNLLNN